MRFRRQQQRWVLSAQSGDREALDHLLRSIQQPLFNYLLQLLQDRHLAEDVLQESFLRIYRKLYWLREPAAFPAWAYRIASRQAFRTLQRRRQSETPLAEPSVDESLLDNADVTETLHADVIEKIPELIADLSPASRAVLSLHYLNDMTLAEVADVLSITPGTAKSRLAYGLSQLRRRLARSDSEISSAAQSH